MHPATTPRDTRSDTRLLAVDRDTGAVRDGDIADLPALLRRGDLLVVNDAATLPGSLHARTKDDQPVELRLTGAPDGDTVRAVVFGAGDWRTPTERRPPPPPLRPGDLLHLVTSPTGHVPEDLSHAPVSSQHRSGQVPAGISPAPAVHIRPVPEDLSAAPAPTAPIQPVPGDLSVVTATILAVDPRTPRLVQLQLSVRGAALWAALYRLGRPVQYSYQGAPLALWSVQTAFAARPWAAEMPSAARPLAWSTLLALRRAGVGIAALTHAAGLSSTGDPTLDAALPLPERYDLPAATIAEIQATRARGGRIIAVGTTVVRALEGCVDAHGELRPGPGETDLVLTADFTPRVIDGLLTGMHDPSESHFHLLRAFAGEAVLLTAWRHANAEAYLQHEFGDATLLIRDLAA